MIETKLRNIQRNLKKAELALNGIYLLSDRDSSFAVIAVRCNSESSQGKRKLVPDQIYYLLDGYSFEDSITSNQRCVEGDLIYDDYLISDYPDAPHVVVSAIVGQNGSGKSSLVEFMIRLINNYAAATFGEVPTSRDERLHYIEGVKGDLWFEIDGFIYQLNVNDEEVEIYVLEVNDGRQEKHTIYSSKTTKNANDGVFFRLSDDCLREIYSRFFFSLVSNYSIYAYNSKDFKEENDSPKKLDSLKKYVKDQTLLYSGAQNWINGLFHKNDGYQIPLVLTPQRKNGNIDVNNEKTLATERLIYLLVTNEKFRVINGHLKVESLSLGKPKGVYDYKYIKNRFFIKKNFSKQNYQAIRKQIVKSWGEKLGKELEDFSHKAYYKTAIDYLTYKTIKIAATQKDYQPLFLQFISSKGKLYIDILSKIIEAESINQSHVTRKIYQTLAYIVGDVYSENLAEEKEEKLNILDIEARFKNNFKLLLNDYDDFMSMYRSHLVGQLVFPPPFLNSWINLCELSDENQKISFDSLSSGERQISFAVSSILYHLDNLNSVFYDKSDDLRIPYRNVFIVLEEVELYFHPELQQALIQNILNGIKQIALDNIKGIHILMVTHSPYVLSDIPHQNVLALENNGEPSTRALNTFCANIHEMLEDSFFLSDGTQGYFAQWEVGQLMSAIRIHQSVRRLKDVHLTFKDLTYSEDDKHNKVLQDLFRRYSSKIKRRKTQRLDYDSFCKDFSIQNIEKRIALIDEPVIRSVLESELYRAIDTDKDLKEELIKELEEKLRKLKDSI